MLSEENLEMAFRRHRENVLNDPKRLQFDSATLEWFCETPFQSMAEMKQIHSHGDHDRKIHWELTTCDVWVIPEASSHWKRWQKRVHECLERHAGHQGVGPRTVCLRTFELEQIPKPGWKKVAEQIADAKGKGFSILSLDRDATVDIHAARDLYAEVMQGDIKFSNQQVISYLQQRLHSIFIAIAGDVVKAPLRPMDVDMSVTQVIDASLKDIGLPKRGSNRGGENAVSMHAGMHFHQLAAQITAWLRAENPQLDGDALWSEVWRRFLRPHLSNTLDNAGVEPSVLDEMYIWVPAIEAFCSRLQQQVGDGRPWSEWLVAEERELPPYAFEHQEKVLRVGGRVDALRRFSNEDENLIELVDYKVTQDPTRNEYHDRLQMALYVHLINQTPGWQCGQATLEYYTPECHPITISLEELEMLYNDRIAPILGRLAQDQGVHLPTGQPLKPAPTKQPALPGTEGPPVTEPLETPESSETPAHSELEADDDPTLPLGYRMQGTEISNERITMPPHNLTKHVSILAGSGSGKTVLIKRIVEEAALLGIPSIVVDSANDLSLLGDAWPESGDHQHHVDDAEKLQRYFDRTETIIWTPGQEGGNPINLDPLPDLIALKDDPDQLRMGHEMALEAMKPLANIRNSARDYLKKGILAEAIKCVGREGPLTFKRLIPILSERPDDVGMGMGQTPRLAREIADAITASLALDPLLTASGPKLDPAKLFTASNEEKTRLSVISMANLGGLEKQQQFVNQLAMTLFTWIKEHPAPEEEPIRGLLILDEAKDLIPSGKVSPCKESLIRLINQARKYGLGLIFATQAPRSIDHQVIANSSTLFIGKANSPTAISTVQNLLRDKGGHGEDVGRLKTGAFYLATEIINGQNAIAPVKIGAPLCLSWHPPTPPDREGVRKRARASRRIVSEQ